MMASTTTAGQSRRRDSSPPARRWRAAAAVAAALVLAGCASPGPAAPAPTATAVQPAGAASPDTGLPAQGTPAAAASAAPPAVAPSRAGIPVRPATATPAAAVPPPTWLTVPGTSIDMAVVPGGVSAGGAMEIPDAFDRAAWYRFGPAPGAAQGSAVIAGHIDTTSDRAPFSALKSLPAGAVIRVGRDGAPALTYRVVKVELMAKDKFDGASLFRRSGPHELKVVTCGGRWLDERMDYSDNVIVTAVLE
ncbi:class F sortase [Arthrobacter sp. MAHUQ-56]